MVETEGGWHLGCGMCPALGKSLPCCASASLSVQWGYRPGLPLGLAVAGCKLRGSSLPVPPSFSPGAAEIRPCSPALAHTRSPAWHRGDCRGPLPWPLFLRLTPTWSHSSWPGWPRTCPAEGHCSWLPQCPKPEPALGMSLTWALCRHAGLAASPEAWPGPEYGRWAWVVREPGLGGDVQHNTCQGPCSEPDSRAQCLQGTGLH